MHMPIDPATIAIRAHNVTLSLGTRDAPVEILKGVDLVMLRGESIAILGASGSGKSSLMAVLCGLERASGGDVHIGGVDFGEAVLVPEMGIPQVCESRKRPHYLPLSRCAPDS